MNIGPMPKAIWSWALLAQVAACAADAGWERGAGFQSRALVVPAAGRTGFTEMPATVTGVQFTNSLSDVAVANNRILENGSGLALGDVDGDGWCDIYLCGIEGPNVLYRNLGNWKFQDVTL